MKRGSSIYIAAFCLFLAGIGWLCYSSFSSSNVYFLNVAEAHSLGLEKLGNARLFGKVSPAGLRKESNTLSFNLEDQDSPESVILVQYSGIVPDTFKQGAEVIVEGAMAKAGYFQAKVLMTKCPSKYQKENRI